MTGTTDLPPAAPATVHRAEPNARRGLRRVLVLLALCLGGAVAGQALALAIVGAAQGASAPVQAAQLKAGFKKATGQALVADKLRSSTSGLYTAYGIGIQTVDRKARYGTFTVFLVTDADVEASVARLLANPQTGAVGTPDAAGIHWEKGQTPFGEPYWRAKRRYGANLVLWWVGEKPAKKLEPSYTTLNKALLAVLKKR